MEFYNPMKLLRAYHHRKIKMMLEKKRLKCKSEKDGNKIIRQRSEMKINYLDFILQIHNSSKYWEAYYISRCSSEMMTPPTARKR